eukprot:3726683-Amphidinium_carterae.1
MTATSPTWTQQGSTDSNSKRRNVLKFNRMSMLRPIPWQQNQWAWRQSVSFSARVRCFSDAWPLRPERARVRS